MEDSNTGNSYNKPIILINRGNCNFVLKVKNAQKAGAQLAIIVDHEIINDGYVYMADDGSGSSVIIPSVFIKSTSYAQLNMAMNEAKANTGSNKKENQDG